MDNIMVIGLVKWFDFIKGFGVVETPDDGEYFVHVTNFINLPEKVLIGTPLSFTAIKDNVKNKNSAENISIVGKSEDWGTILSYLNKSDRVCIEVEISGRGKQGKPFRKKETQSFSLIDKSLELIFRDKSDDEVSNIITNYYDANLEVINIIQYCEFLENKLWKYLPYPNSTKILNSVFRYFGEHLSDKILFDVWKEDKFKFISYIDNDDYEIPQSVLLSNMQEIDISILTRIKSFSYGVNFCEFFTNEKFKNLEIYCISDIKYLYELLGFVSAYKLKTTKSELDIFFTQKYIVDLSDKAKSLGSIKNCNDFESYNKLFQLIPNQIDDVYKKNITQRINELIILKCAYEFKPELWIKGIVEEVPFESVSKIFLDENTLTEKLLTILAKLQLVKQFELLKNYSLVYDFEKAFALLEELVKRESSTENSFDIKTVLLNHESFRSNKYTDLVKLFSEYANNESSEAQKYSLFIKGYVKNVPQLEVLKNTHNLDESDCRQIFINHLSNKVFISEVLDGITLSGNLSDYSWLYRLAGDFLNENDYNSFDIKIYESIERPEYYKLWSSGLAKIFPENYISEFLNDDFENYNQINIWIENKNTTSIEIQEYLFAYLRSQNSITNRITFRKHLNHIYYLMLLNELYVAKLKHFNNGSYNIILWFLDKATFFDFEQLKLNFIYFAPDEQVRLMKKLFFLKANNEFDFTVEQLNDLTRFDYIFLKNNQNVIDEIQIDISTDVIIKALMSFKHNKRFFFENEILAVVLDDLRLDRSRRFKLVNYFEECLGREIPKFDKSTNGEIRKVNFGENQYYYAISFPTGESVRESYRGDYSYVYRKNPNFDDLKEAVKKLPATKWNPADKHWGVPSKYKTHILNFAKEYKFHIDFDGSELENNVHLVEFKRTDKPNGINFCEGRLANRSDNQFDRVFWWCEGYPCYSKCETIHPKEEWEKYTLLDFCEILGFNTDEINKMGDLVPKGYYYHFVALINRFNRLLDRLYCRDCNHILYPSNFGTSHFAAHTIVRFQCRNEICSNNEEIYLNHCLNGLCNAIIDSRVSKRCSNGLLICDNCGSCCSHKQFETRLKILQRSDVANTQKKQWIINDLIVKVNNLEGHLERGEYFCFKCNADMTKVRENVYQCTKCNVTYNTKHYKNKKQYLNDKIKPTENNDDEAVNNDDIDIPAF